MTRAAAKYDVPLAVLFAIGLTETGRRGALHPYALNIAGRSFFGESAAHALREFERERRRGIKLIDLGCMQINHHYHKQEFEKPRPYARPGAQRRIRPPAFLRELRDREGDWTARRRPLPRRPRQHPRPETLRLRRSSATWSQPDSGNGRRMRGRFVDRGAHQDRARRVMEHADVIEGTEETPNPTTPPIWIDRRRRAFCLHGSHPQFSFASARTALAGSRRVDRGRDADCSVHAEFRFPNLQWRRRCLVALQRGGPASARTLLSSLLSGLMTMTSLVISMTFVILTLAASQLGPRLISMFISDRQIQAVLGLFIGTIVYIIAILRSVDENLGGDGVPHAAVTLASLLTLICLFALLVLHPQDRPLDHRR